MKELKIIERMGACDSSLEWLAKQSSYEQAWKDCERGDWMLWLVLKKLDGSEAAHRRFTLAKARCAETVIHLMKDERSRNAIAVAKKYGVGEATNDELKTAAAAAADDARKENQILCANLIREIYPEPPRLQ